MTHRQPNRTIPTVLGMILAMTLGTAASADSVRFHVAFEDVPGSDQLEAGNVEDGIAILEAAYAEGRVDEGDALATLCGAHLLRRALVKARSYCSKAAKRYPSQTSLNNYGIYLAVVGDFEGAIENFRKVQPLTGAEYLEYLRTKDIGLIALQNEAVVRDYKRGRAITDGESVKLSALIEELPN